jgi:glutaminyl-peptide cyclotransferase
MRAALAIALVVSCGCAQSPEYTYRVVHAYPHDPTAFTQGLEYHDGFLYEGTGREGYSTLRRVALETGKVLQRIDLAPNYFGEGITVINGRVVQLTYKSQTGFVYDRANFRLLRNFTYSGEGWGLTNDGSTIYMSDGSAQIRFWDPQTLQERKRITVREGARAIDNLNELEWVHGEIYANIWQTNRIARISPADGHVIAWIDLTGLLKPEDLAEPVDVLNGIAYDAAHDRLFVTGKLWPKLFEIKIVPKMTR